MPAIHLPRLRQQIENLVDHYADADKFSRELKHLFNYYGDKTLRSSKLVRRPAGLPSENVPAPVLRQVVVQMTPYAENTPHAIISLVRGLWKHPVLEYRHLAALMIGKLPASQASETLRLVTEWGQTSPEEILLSALAVNSLNTLQQDAPDEVLERIRIWLHEPQQDTTPAQRTSLQKLGLAALLPFVSDPDYENLPRIYALLTPLLQAAPKALRPYLLDLLLPLARRAPQEITYLLRTLLEEDPNQHLVWLARRTLEALPPEYQTRLQPLITPRREE
jgi:hypothetical protein